METTVKVDINKLQLLNDRICQALDALNQVRLNAHGLGISHSTASVGPAGAVGAVGAVPGIGAWPGAGYGAFATPYGGVPGWTPGVGLGVNPLVEAARMSGIGHSAYAGYTPYAPVGPLAAHGALAALASIGGAAPSLLAAEAAARGLAPLAAANALTGIGHSPWSPVGAQAIAPLAALAGGFAVDPFVTPFASPFAAPFTVARMQATFPFAGSPIAIG